MDFTVHIQIFILSVVHSDSRRRCRIFGSSSKRHASLNLGGRAALRAEQILVGTHFPAISLDMSRWYTNNVDTYWSSSPNWMRRSRTET